MAMTNDVVLNDIQMVAEENEKIQEDESFNDLDAQDQAENEEEDEAFGAQENEASREEDDVVENAPTENDEENEQKNDKDKDQESLENDSYDEDTDGKESDMGEEYDPDKPEIDRSETTPTGDKDSPLSQDLKRKADEEIESKEKRPKIDASGEKKSRQKSTSQDRQGLSEAVWDRLMDLQSGPNFRINNVSRAALSSIGVLPEFAQLTIIARFCRAPMESIHNKNGHLLSLLSEFLRDNPHVENLKPVSTFVGDSEQDPGLFEYGYAPPYPTNGLSTVPVPYHHDETAKETVDEFGRAAHQRPSDPRRARREDKSQEQGGLLTSGKPTDPRRRNAPALGGIAAYDKSDTFHHLPRSVQAVLEDIYNSGKLPEAINDSVIARLLKLPEYIAVRAAESFRKVDIGKIENLQGFLVGIINRVHERALAAEAAEGRNQYGGGNKRAPASVYQDPQPSSVVAAGGDYKYNYNPPQQDYVGRSSTYRFSDKPGHQAAILALPVSVQNHLVQLAQSGVLTSVDEFGEKCYEVLNQLTEDLANEVLKRFGSTNLTQVRNRSGFLIGVVKRVRQEFNYH